MRPRAIVRNGVHFPSYRSLLQVDYGIKGKKRQVKKELYRVKVIGKPHRNADDRLVVKVHYIGYSSRFDEDLPVQNVFDLREFTLTIVGIRRVSSQMLRWSKVWPR